MVTPVRQKWARGRESPCLRQPRFAANRTGNNSTMDFAELQARAAELTSYTTDGLRGKKGGV